jgi:hypothetical protein
MKTFLAWLTVISVSASFALSQGPKRVERVVIRSSWGGLGPRRDDQLEVVRGKDGFTLQGKPVDSVLVETLIHALQAPAIAHPQAENLGITVEWLHQHGHDKEPKASAQGIDTTPGQHSLYESAIMNPQVIAKALPGLFNNMHTDDYPHVRLEVRFTDGSKLKAASDSQFPFMLPWSVGGRETYDAGISRALAALMREKTTNRERLAGEDLSDVLIDGVMQQIEDEWNLRGAEDTVGPDLERLRRDYRIKNVELDGWLTPQYGPEKFDSEKIELSLHAKLHRASMPVNVFTALTLKVEDGKLIGLDEFLEQKDRYEKLVLSVPWLREYIRQHPKVRIDIQYVDDASMGLKALSTFRGDMKLREKPQLIAEAEQKRQQIALVTAGDDYRDTYWLIFPDKQMVLWRYLGPGGLLHWKPKDFGEGECADYPILNGGCSGRTVSPEGVLVAEGMPRDLKCVTEWRQAHPAGTPEAGALFDVFKGEESAERHGLIDTKGEVRLPFCFDDLGDASEGMVRFERDGRWGYLDTTGKVVIEPRFPWAEDFHEGRAFVQVGGEPLDYNGRWAFIDSSGNLVTKADFEQLHGDGEGELTRFYDGLAMVQPKDNEYSEKKGFIDRDGRMVIAARFTYVDRFAEGLAAATESRYGETGWGHIDKSGQWAIQPQFNWAESFGGGLAPVTLAAECRYIDAKGATLIANPRTPADKYCSVKYGSFSEGLARWAADGRFGYMARNGDMVIPPQFDEAMNFSEGLAAVNISGKWGFIDKSGKYVVPLGNYKWVKPFQNGLSRVGFTDDSWGYIDRTGKTIWKSAKR